jgi:hypothetical protein
MSATFFMFLFGGILALFAVAFHVAMIVHGFKTSVGWGLICLLLGSLGSLIFAFARFGGGARRVWAVVYLVAILGCGGLLSVAAYQTAQAQIGADKAAEEGMKEVEAQIDNLSEVEDIQLDL